jgi:cytochrome c-type biogenesis protein CcmF
MNYIGENLIPGQLGHFCVVLSFVASLLSAFSYFQSASKRNTPEESDWLRLGRFSFMLHGTERSFSIIGLLFYILVGKMYEYNYAWANVSDDLPVQYVFSAFWKEQQGSFLLWSFWHIILSAIIIVRGGKWEAPVLTVVALTMKLLSAVCCWIVLRSFPAWRQSVRTSCATL